jgi:hypothetical protein
MQNKEVVEAVNKVLEDIIKVNTLFGGIHVVPGGNWAQILPVVQRGSQGDSVKASLQSSNIWSSLRQLFLRRNMRAIGPKSALYIEWL